MYFMANSRRLTFVLFAVIVLILSSIDSSQSANSDHLGFLSPLPTGNTINDAWSSDGQNFFFAGDGGTILQYDGSTFTVMSTPTNVSLQGIHGISMANVWAVGGNPYLDSSDVDRSVILHYDGSTWLNQTPPKDTFDQYHAFDDVWCDGSGTVWAVSQEMTMIARSVNGGSWSYIDTGLILSNYGFYSVYGFSASDLYAVGGCGQIIHYNGATWTMERQTTGGCPSISTDLLFDVWGPDSLSVFVTGNNSQALKRESNGAWTTIYGGGLFSNASKYSISGSSASNIYFAGLAGELDHWDGTSYTRILDSGAAQYVMAINAAGNYYIGQEYGKVSSFNGATRTALTTPPISGMNWKFAQRAERIWLCKADVNPGDTVYAWDGTTLTEVDPGFTAQYRLTAFKVFSENDIFIAGYGLGVSGSFAKRYNGSSWINVNYGTGSLLDVALSGSDVFTITGSTWDNDMGTMLGNPCVSNVCYGANTFKAMALADDGKVYAVGKGGAIVSYSGGVWGAEVSGTTNDLTSVAAGGGWVCVAGRDRTLMCKQGAAAWHSVTGLETKPENKFLGIAYSGESTFVAILNTGNDGSSAYIGADKGTLYKIGAGEATLLRTGMSSSLGGIGSNAEGEIAVAGTGGIVYGNILTSSPCPDCSKADVMLGNYTFRSGQDCECTAASSITLGPNVTVENGAKVRLKAPTVNFKAEVNVEEGADFRTSQ